MQVEGCVVPGLSMLFLRELTLLKPCRLEGQYFLEQLEDKRQLKLAGIYEKSSEE